MATVIAFHAHPDDEALLSGGTLAKLAEQGHRVLVVVATDGTMGPATAPGGQLRMDELRASAAALGIAGVLHLGYADSGHGPILFPDPPDRARFARADAEEAAARLADVITAERADLLLSYDRNGGYGHRDHVKVHEVGARAAELAGSVRVLEATVPRDLIAIFAGPLWLLRLVVRHNPVALAALFTPRRAITHRVIVRRQAGRKRAALNAHHSQLGARGRASRAFRVLVMLPDPVFGLLLGREWYAEPGAAPGKVCDDVLRPRPVRA